jgi:predicted transcriptional regulator with HTH domain
MKTSILKRITLSFFGIALLAGISSCSKKNDGPTTPTSKGKTAKFTVTVKGAPSSAYISFVMAGVASDPSNTTVWKVNGTTQSNEQAVSLGANKFTSTTQTYVIESVTPLQAISVGVQCLSPANVAYTISYKAEINGEVKADNQNVSVTKDADFTHDYTY